MTTRLHQRGARSLSLWCMAAYLALTGVAFASARSWWVVGLHIALLAMLGWSMPARSPIARITGDLAPIIFATALAYGEVPQLVGIFGSSYRDALVQGMEQATFGGQPAHTLAGALPYTWLSELLHGGYVAFYLATFVPPLLLYLRQDRRGFHETVLALTVTWTLCCAFFVFFPVEGPRYLWQAPPNVPQGPMRWLSTTLLAAGSSRGAAFPSLHMAGSASQSIMAWCWQPRWVAWAVTVISILVGVGAVYGGFHYAIDILVGAAVGAVIGAFIAVLSRQNNVYREIATSDSIA